MVEGDAAPPVRFVLANQPVVLSSVNVRDRETCRVGADTGLMVARVWEEARKAMLTTQLVAEGTPLFAEWIEFDRGLDSTARVVKEQRIRTSRNPTTHAFRSRPATELDSTGYVVSDSSGTTYFAPDADVLLSEPFAAGHCFHLVEPPRSAGAANLIGVAFQPARESQGKQEIQGTLWLDRASAELKSIEFRYTNLPDVVSPAEPGGRVDFLRLSDGGWLVSRWNVRMPRVGPRGRAPQVGLGRMIVTTSAASMILRGVQITGGEVTRVTRRDTLVYAATGPSITLTVVSRDSLVRTSAAWMSLDGTDYSASGDSTGMIRLSPVLAGRYRARVSVPLMDSLGMPPVEREVDTRLDAHVDTLVLPSARDVLFAACPRDSVRNGEGMVYGRVRTGGAAPLAGAAVTITWQSAAADTRRGVQAAYSENTLGSLTNEAGYWRVCGVPHDMALAVSIASDSGSDARRLQLDASRAFGTVDLVARREAVGSANAPAAGKAGRALVEIMVNEWGGPPLPDVTIEVTASGRTRRVVTGSTGRALIPDVTPGVLTVRARRIGFKQGELTVPVEAGRNTIPILLSTADLPTLDTVRVVGNNRLVGIRRNDEFEMRRQLHQSTISFTEDDIQKRNPVDTYQMLTNVPALRIIDVGKVTAETTRSNNIDPVTYQLKKCYAQVMVDGLMLEPMPGEETVDLRLLPKPSEIHGIEVFAGPAQIPPQYGGEGKNKWCGLIAIWTK